MKKKTLKIIGTILAFSFTFIIHGLYEKFPCFLTSIFAPVNESIWEHMKVLFGSIILSGVVQKLIIAFKKERINNICLSNFIGALVSIPIFLTMFLPVYYTLGENMVVTIIIMLISIIISEIIAFIIMDKKDFKFENKTIFFVIGIYLIFTLLSYFPLKNGLFIDPTTETYGIQK